ncbi:unnamed protein product [Chrysoparadoxa australica]
MPGTRRDSRGGPPPRRRSSTSRESPPRRRSTSRESPPRRRSSNSPESPPRRRSSTSPPQEYEPRRPRRSESPPPAYSRDPSPVIVAEFVEVPDQGDTRDSQPVMYDWTNWSKPAFKPARHSPWFSYFATFTFGIILMAEFGQFGWHVENLSKNPMIGVDVHTLIDMGAKRGDLIITSKQWWRLATAFCIHAGVIQYVLNVFGLLSVSADMEREFGWARILSLYVVSAFWGLTLGTLLVPEQVATGPTAGVLGIVGAACADLFQHWSLHEYPWANLLSLVLYTLIVLAAGIVPFVDNWASFGGFMMGLMLGFGMVLRREEGWGLSHRKCKVTVGVITWILAFIVYVISLSVLYQGEGGSCSQACVRFGCLELPWAAASDDKWWYCSDCRLYGFTLVRNRDNSGYVICPDDIVVPFELEAGPAVEVCETQCATDSFDYVDEDIKGSLWGEEAEGQEATP